MKDILSFLARLTKDGLLSFRNQQVAAEHFSLSLAEVEKIALENEILPARYQRNRTMFTTKQQATLFQSSVTVVGCGGLGGYIIEELARLGIGRISVIDPDFFEEHNLNRQILSNPDLLGEKKIIIAAKRISEINPAVDVQTFCEKLNDQNGPDLLYGTDVVADGLDSVPDRLTLAQVCRQLDLPLVHGAIAGWYGHLATQLPGDKTIELIYPEGKKSHGVETTFGNPSFTPAVVASLQVSEIIKLLLDIGETLRNKYLSIDLYHMEMNAVKLNTDEL